MKRKITLFAVFALTGILLWRCGTHTGSGSGQSATDSTTVHLPSNVLMLDSVSQQTISTWFAGGVVSPGGLIFPANSLGFKVIDTTTNVDFYKWSEQMFLWITSPVGNKSIVLESPTFYTVIDNRDGTRNLSQNNFGKQVTMKANLPQVGPHGLHLIRAKNGKRFEVETSDEKKKETVIDGSGKTIEVGQVKLVGNNVAQFLDVSGKTISHPKPLIVAKSNTSNIVHRFKAGKKFIFLDANGNQIETEEGQAGGDNVLISQNGSMVYYMTMVNDVYAWYLTMFKDTTQKNVAKQFPTDTAGLNRIIRYAAKHNAKLGDANALAMEIKTSWVIASTLPDTSGYVIIPASIPTFTKTNDSVWTATGHDTTQRMALVGMHVVGSVANHPEMIWATFEHKSNSPNTAYHYINNKNKVDTVQADHTTGWLFSSGSTTQNAQVMTFNSGPPVTITSTGAPIGAVNTLREAPWGCADTLASNPVDTTAARSNSELISFNASMQKLLSQGDVRKNYLFIGATWTTGVAPNGTSYTNIQSITGAALGTSYLANSTMETANQYIQNGPGSCFSCHGGTLNPNVQFGLSHVFHDIKPLPTSGGNGSNYKTSSKASKQ